MKNKVSERKDRDDHGHSKEFNFIMSSVFEMIAFCYNYMN